MQLASLLTKARPHIARYGLAAVFAIACAGVRLYLDEYFTYRYFSTVFFYPAVVVAAYSCGLGPAILAGAFSASASRYLFMRPMGQFSDLVDPWDTTRLTFFILGSSAIAYLISQLQDARTHLSTLASEAIESRDTLRQEQELLHRLITQQETEKQTLCNDFHDGLIQHVVGSKMLLEARLDTLPADHTMHEVVRHLGKGIEDGRRVIRGIRPSVLDEPGLEGPLHELVEHFSAGGLDVDVDYCPDCPDSDVPDETRTAVFRICQEALTNSWKHSGCTKATVRIEKQDDYLHVEIDDDGRGIGAYPYAATGGFGLKGMDARARLLGGDFDVLEKEKGTRIRVRLPLASEQTAHPTPCTGWPDLRADIMSRTTPPAKFVPHATRYVLSAMFVGVCLLLRLSLDDYFRDNFLLTGLFYPAVLAAAYFLGFGPALLSAAISVAAIRYFFMPPLGQFFVLPYGWHPVRLLFFVLGSSALAYLISQLQDSRNRLSSLISAAIRSRNQLHQEQEFLRRLIAQQEQEKQLLCNDFHDGLIQHVVGSQMLLKARLDDLPTGDPIHEIVHHLDKGLEDGRRVIRGLRPSALDEPGLGGVLHELAAHFSGVGLDVSIDCCPDGNDHDVPDAIRTAVFRICQEALTNCWKHSGGTTATVRVEKQGDCLFVEIDDDGCGIDPSRHSTTEGFGLKGMAARARLLGGSLDVTGMERGTRVRVRLPLSLQHTA